MQILPINIKIKKVAHSALICLFVYLFICLFLPNQSNAADLDLSISPPLIQIQTISPATIKTPFIIQNEADTPISLDIFLQPFKANQENGTIQFLKSTEKFGDDPKIFDKISIFDGDNDINSLELAPKQSKTLVMQVVLPQGEPASDYYFSVIFLRHTSDQSVKTSYSQSTGGIGMNVLLTVSGKIQAQGSIEEFSAPWIMEKGPVPFTVRVKNEGSHVIAPVGSILITNMFGQRVGKIDLQPVNILAGSIRSMPDKGQTEDVTQNLQQSTILVANPHAIWPEPFLLGPYTASLTIKLSDNGPVFYRDIHFIGLPVEAVLALIIGVTVVLLVRERVKRRMNKKTTKEQ